MISKWKRQIAKTWVLLKNNPKQTYGYMMIIILISFVLALTRHLYFPPEPNPLEMPTPYQNEVDSAPHTNKVNENKMKPIVKELQGFKTKRGKGQLTKEDSLRIEYLYNKYQSLKK